MVVSSFSLTFIYLNIDIYILDAFGALTTSKSGIIMGTPPILIATGDSFGLFSNVADIFMRSEMMRIVVMFFISNQCIQYR